MSNDQIKRIIEDSYDESREEGVLAMSREFYSRRMRAFAIMTWVFGSIFVALAVYSAIRFFKTDQTRGQIMYATLCFGGMYGLGLIKILAFVMLNGHCLRREIKRLELRIAELTETLQGK